MSTWGCPHGITLSMPFTHWTNSYVMNLDGQFAPSPQCVGAIVKDGANE